MAVGLKSNELVFEFPEIHKDAELRVTFHRTVRIPDDGKKHKLPVSLGAFSLKSIDDLPADRLPSNWPKRGGVVMPMWQSEAMWMSFSSPSGYPFAIKIAAGKINAVSGNSWTEKLDHSKQDFVEVPGQRWLDGFCVSKGVIRQFVAMPLGAGYSAEEQITGKAENGGLQLLVIPLKGAEWDKRQEKTRREGTRWQNSMDDGFFNDNWAFQIVGSSYSASPILRSTSLPLSARAQSMDMSIAAGGKMEQDIYSSTTPQDQWETSGSRCFVAIANSLSWRHCTGEEPPHLPLSAADYAAKGMPWFDLYSDKEAVNGAPALAGLKSVKDISAEKGEFALPENLPISGDVKTVHLGKLPRSGAAQLEERVF